ncbi:RCC1 domain-containing protein [Nannocystis pusilla]|uniref:RCC1 domain-containing protein n=1 Tax=Nannocystis pusilla TaxID=889268 RepID=UPI003B75DF62
MHIHCIPALALSLPLAACGPKLLGSLDTDSASETTSTGETTQAPGDASTTTASSSTTGSDDTTTTTTAAPPDTTLATDTAESTSTSGGSSCEDCPPVLQVAGSGNHTCALVEGGRLRCWGLGQYGALGLGNTQNVGDDELPAEVPDVDVGGEVVEVVAYGGGAATCARLAGGDVRCWGGETNFEGLLGRQDPAWIGDDEAPSSIAPIVIGGPVVQLTLGGSHACARLEDGAVRCWGAGTDGRLGYGNPQNIGDDEDPADAGDVDVGEPVLHIAAGGVQTCALLAGGRVRCWGNGSNGALGYGIFDPEGPPQDAWIGDDETPASMGDVPIGGFVTQLVTGVAHTCALLDTGGVRCWGEHDFGGLGYGPAIEGEAAIGDDETPASLGDIPLDHPAIQIAAGYDRTCALLDTGALRCWGYNVYGALGIASPLTDTKFMTPVELPDVLVGGDVAAIALSFEQTCAILTTGALRCWGRNFWGELGYGHTQPIGDDEHPAAAGDVPYL